jgi:hypothetical protein
MRPRTTRRRRESRIVISTGVLRRVFRAMRVMLAISGEAARHSGCHADGGL